MKKNAIIKPPVQKRNHRIILFHISLITVIGLLLIFYFLYLNRKITASQIDSTYQTSDCQSSFTMIRKNDPGLVRPLMLADFEKEAPRYTSLKAELIRTIDLWKQRGVVKTASVYLRDLNQGNWMSINGNDQYLPGSLMKVAIMLYFLKQEELHPGVLNQELLCEKPKNNFPKQAFEGDSIIPGKRYKNSALLKFMIEESDNYATHILSQEIDAREFHNLFTDIQMPPDDINDVNYVINVSEYSKLMRVLYNATYVNEKLSQLGLELLSKSKFKDGMAKKLPPNIVIAHKFGERGINNVSDFSESGIIYYKNSPYLLTIMTKGTDSKGQAELISELSNEIFQNLKSE